MCVVQATSLGTVDEKLAILHRTRICTPDLPLILRIVQITLLALTSVVARTVSTSSARVVLISTVLLIVESLLVPLDTGLILRLLAFAN